MVTIIADRESDIYEEWARLPDGYTHLLTRAAQDRCLADGSKLFTTLPEFAEAHRFELELPARPGKRKARQAHLAVRLRRPKSCANRSAPCEIELHAIEAREIDPPRREHPILWRLLTTHSVDSVKQALTVIGSFMPCNRDCKATPHKATKSLSAR